MAVSPLLTRFSNDTSKEEAGVWTDFGDGIRVKIRRIRSKKSQDVRKELDQPHVGDIRRGALPDNIAEDLLLKQTAAGVIADWEGIDFGNHAKDFDLPEGSIPYTPENAYKVLKALPELRDEILQVSMSAESFRKVFLEDQVIANLSTTSDGT